MSGPATPAASPAPAAIGPAEGPARRGRPRSQQAGSAILAAAAALLTEGGFAALSIEEVAARSGVAKTTIYRRWTSRGTLALDAFLADFQSQQPSPDTGTLAGDMLAALRAWIQAVTRTSAGPILAGLIAESQRDQELGIAWRERVVDQLRSQHKIMLNRAVGRGEIPPDTDQEVVLDLLFGAAYHRLLHGHQPLTDAFARQVVSLIIAGVQHRDDGLVTRP